ncbi:hypothetical protein BKA60DRAFT_602358 [Fusarium oxysporum]|nr:hypothetical protein BKA60DRAFT_602358 [Fusarium oxysporum]
MRQIDSHGALPLIEDLYRTCKHERGWVTTSDERSTVTCYPPRTMIETLDGLSKNVSQEPNSETWTQEPRFADEAQKILRVLQSNRDSICDRATLWIPDETPNQDNDLVLVFGLKDKWPELHKVTISAIMPTLFQALQSHNIFRNVVKDLLRNALFGPRNRIFIGRAHFKSAALIDRYFGKQGMLTRNFMTRVSNGSATRRGPWCSGPPIGPGVQACHIITQHHHHVYPVMSGDSDDDKFSLEESNRRLKEAWQSTWSPRNGILLMKNLHEFFDARLFSIHPYTHRIRVFVPYDALTKFNGKKASVHTTIDRKALRHHYTMSCIENMAADRPILDVISPFTSRMTSGKATPLTARTDLPATLTSPTRRHFDAR